MQQTKIITGTLKTGVEQNIIMTTQLKWRLGKLPTPDEVTTLLKEKVITKEEAREILFNFGTEEDRDKKSLESEIKFLRQLVEELSRHQSYKLIEIIREVKPNWPNQPWYHPYATWCNSATTTAGERKSGLYNYSSTTDGAANVLNATASGDISGSGQAMLASITEPMIEPGQSFTEIKTF